ncbi:hypothetical protein [Microlunatus sp. GCM10028923]|uniref:hypothetical protein n=1 Tax=Microlunatus sp. GCM10028923 TaxID=3273400 RepID=UPI00361A4CAC
MIMKIVGNPPSPFRVTLTSGAAIVIAANTYGRTEDHYVFETLVEAPKKERDLDWVKITSTNPTDPKRVTIAVMAIPVEEVAAINSGEWEQTVPPAYDGRWRPVD